MFDANQSADQPLTYARQCHPSNRDALVTKHLPLVRRVAWHVSSRMSSSIAIEDLIQIGIVALIESANVFEERGVGFSPYASVRIKGAMIDELRKVARMGRAGMANKRRLNAVRARVEASQGRAANDRDMIDALDIEAPAYFAMVESAVAVGEQPIDDVYSDHDWSFADPAPIASDLAEASEERAVLSRALSQLAEREALILQLFFVEELNLHEIGNILGIGAARVCQIKKSALAKARLLFDENAKGAAPAFQEIQTQC